MPQSTDEFLLILDLDETLIHATLSQLEISPEFTIGPYSVYLRPGLTGFLDEISKHFQLAIWSSSTDDYMRPILSQIIPNEIRLEFAWSRTRCVSRFHPELQTQYWLKDLKKVKRVGYNLARVLIVDDEKIKLQRNYRNAIYVLPFTGSPEDNELALLAAYLRSLTSVEDVRTIEKRNWRDKAQRLDYS